MDTKAFWQSKTIWLNVLAAIGGIVQTYTGFVISPELQGAVLIILNVILRFVTKSEITW